MEAFYYNGKPMNNTRHTYAGTINIGPREGKQMIDWIGDDLLFSQWMNGLMNERNNEGKADSFL